jgi:non-ribosomal peptide synthetase component F
MNPVTLDEAATDESLRESAGTDARSASVTMSVSTPAAARVQDAPPASRALNEGRVLIADDEAGVRWQTGERLEHLFEQRVDALAAQGRADAIAVDGPKGPITYAELDARANQLARHLGLRVGVRAGDRVALLLARGW